MQALLKWLGALGEGSATAVTVGSLAGTIFTIVWSAVKAHRKHTAAAMKEADKPVAPQQTAGDLAELRERLRDIERDQDLARLRWQCDELIRQLQTAAREREQLHDALTSERAANELLRAEIARLEQDLANALVQPADEAITWTSRPRDVFAHTPPKLPKPRGRS